MFSTSCSIMAAESGRACSCGQGRAPQRFAAAVHMQSLRLSGCMSTRYGQIGHHLQSLAQIVMHRAQHLYLFMIFNQCGAFCAELVYHLQQTSAFRTVYSLQWQALSSDLSLAPCRSSACCPKSCVLCPTKTLLSVLPPLGLQLLH